MGCREVLRMNRATVVLCSVLVLAAGCAAPPEEEAPAPEVDPVAENNAALSELAAKYLQAMNRGDADGLAVLYTEDAIRMQTNSKAKVGRDAIRLFAAADYADTNWDMQLRVDESEYSGDLAFVRGTYALSVSPKDAPSQIYQEVGKWMDVMRRQEDGSWLIAREISNRNHLPGQIPEMPEMPEVPETPEEE